METYVISILDADKDISILASWRNKLYKHNCKGIVWWRKTKKEIAEELNAKHFVYAKRLKKEITAIDELD